MTSQPNPADPPTAPTQTADQGRRRLGTLAELSCSELGQDWRKLDLLACGNRLRDRVPTTILV